MPKRYDATPKGLVELRPADWPAFLSVAARTVEIVDADVSSITAAADKVLLIHSDLGDRLQHFDFQAGPDASLPQRLHHYNALLEVRHQLPVESVLILLRPEANLSAITGIYERQLPGAEESYLRFYYRVVRVWELPVESILQAGVSLLPLAPISAVKQNELPGVIRRMEARLDEELDPTTVAELWTATKILMGLRYNAGLIEHLLQRVQAMKESTTYVAIQNEGRFEAVREVIRDLGKRKFENSMPPQFEAALEDISDFARLRQLSSRILDANTWEELFEQTASKPARKRKKK